MSNVTDHQPPQYPQYPQPAGSDPSGQFYLNQMAPVQPPKKGLPTGAIIGIAVGAFVLLLCAGGVAITALSPSPKSTPRAATGVTTAPTIPPVAPTTPKEVVARLGETLTLTSGSDEAHFTLTAGKPLARTKYGTGPEKGQFFALAATVKVISGSFYVYGGDFAIITAAGQPYEADVSFAFDGGLEGVQANAGQTVTGLVVWDIPRGIEKGAKVELREGFGGNQGFWQLP